MKSPRHLTHLYWRAGFGLSPEEWAQKRDWSRQKAIVELFDQAKKAPALDNRLAHSIIDEAEIKMKGKKMRSELRKKGRQLVFRQNIEWIQRMASPRHPALLERMSLFWHDHFACTTKMPNLAQNQLEAIRQHALGNFRDMVHAICRDVSMIRFLNNQQNKKKQPNENFARELMELFTLGRGHYTERDIKEAARAFTGWSSNLKGEFVFREKHHDYGTKQFMDTSGDLNGDDIVNILLNKKETASFVVTKIYRYFVNDRPDTRRIRQLADRFFHNDYDIADLMKAIFSADWFYEEANIGTKIKSPVELLAGILRQLNVEMDDTRTFKFIQKALGQTLFAPPNVAGWPGGKSWIDNSTLLLRLNLVSYLYGKADVDFKIKDELEAQKRGTAFKKIKGVIDFEPLLQHFRQGKQPDYRADREDTYKELAGFLLQTKNTPRLSDLDSFVDGSSADHYIKSLTLRLMSLPEYQMC